MAQPILPRTVSVGVRHCVVVPTLPHAASSGRWEVGAACMHEWRDCSGRGEGHRGDRDCEEMTCTAEPMSEKDVPRQRSNDHIRNTGGLEVVAMTYHVNANCIRKHSRQRARSSQSSLTEFERISPCSGVRLSHDARPRRYSGRSGQPGLQCSGQRELEHGWMCGMDCVEFLWIFPPSTFYSLTRPCTFLNLPPSLQCDTRSVRGSSSSVSNPRRFHKGA
jgi:hypothetical protein